MFNNNTNTNLFANPYLQESQSSKAPDDINSLYRQIEALKAQKTALTNLQSPNIKNNDATQQNKRTVYNDIGTIWSELSAEERKYIENSEEYQNANIEYQQSFNNFLVEKLGDDYLQSRFGTAPEKVLAVIKKKKEEFQNNITNDISAIKSQNEYLVKKNDELTKSNEEMNKLIKALQEQLFVNK